MNIDGCLLERARMQCALRLLHCRLVIALRNHCSVQRGIAKPCLQTRGPSCGLGCRAFRHVRFVGISCNMQPQHLSNAKPGGN